MSGKLLFPELEDLSGDHRPMMVRAAAELFIERVVAFRESIDGRAVIVFPALIKERPPPATPETEDGQVYVVRGLTQRVYPALVVMLGYSPSYTRAHHWRRQAEYVNRHGHVCGFREVSTDDAQLELQLYFGVDTPVFARDRFRGLFEEILFARDVDVRRYPPVVCSSCSTRQERATVVRRIDRGRGFIVCEECGFRLDLPQEAARVPGARSRARSSRIGNTARCARPTSAPWSP